jgi:predicted dehydrogenase
MTEAAEAARVPTAVGYTYIYNPIIALARDLIANGEIGEVTAFRGIHAEDFMARPDAPFNWRCEAENAGGALADIGSHIISLARHLVGEIEEVSGKLQTIHRTRPHPDGGRREVKIDDQADAIVRFANGATGTVAASWIATGRKNQLAFEINGTKGSLLFTQERFNEIKLYQRGQRGREGFTTILAGPEHPDYGAFCPAGGHQIGYNDLKTAEVKAMLDMVTGKPSAAVDFRWALGVELVAAAIRRSSEEGCWVAPAALT